MLRQGSGDNLSKTGRKMKNLRGLMSMVKNDTFQKKVKIQIEEVQSKEPDIEIKLTSVPPETKERIRFNFKSNQYEQFPDEDLAEDLLTIPSHTILIEELEKIQEERKKLDPKSSSTVSSEMQDFEGIISKEELEKLDSQPNPFNFSDRVSQTTRTVLKDQSVQTEPPPSNSFSANVGLSDIYDAYQKDYEKVLQREKEKESEKDKEKDRSSSKGKQPPPVDPPSVVLAESVVKEEVHTLFGEEVEDVASLSLTARIMERMISQNIYDEIAQDFKYWEDGSDEFRPMEGSLLPLWRFTHDYARSFIVSSVCWSHSNADLFAVGYRSGDITGPEGEGILCVFTMKNPAAPERMIRSSAGFTSVDFHPRLPSVIVAGSTDGTVAVYDVKIAISPVTLKSSAVNAKHIMPVRQVKWINTSPGEDLSFYSVSMDGRVTQWTIHALNLLHTDILDFKAPSTPSSHSFDKVSLEGCGTCIAMRPDDESVLLIGCDTGAIFQCTTAATTHALTKYNAHYAPVRAVQWNVYNYNVFVSCSIDWTIKVWVQYFQNPLVVLDIGGPVAGVCWSPCSSSVIVATTDDGKVHVFDLFLRKCRPLCVQNITPRRKVFLSTIAFSPFHPVILLGGDKGHLVTLKLSPNLRKVHKDAKGGDEQKHREVELAKIERLISISKSKF